MKKEATNPHLAVVVIFFLSTALPCAFAQSQAVNGQIEGIVLDQSGTAVANAAITAANIDTGVARNTTTDENGVYRVPLLPLGKYRIWVEAQSFRKFVQDGVTLATGQSVTVDVRLELGEVRETVTVSSDAPVVDTGKTDLGRVMSTREVHDIPLPTRNPYNFVILQANVTGRPNRGGNYPQANANGFARRVNYLLDGNTNTRGDRAGARIMMISETYVTEMQLLTNSFAAEFGNTTGMIVNMVTPSGTNDIRGSLLYLFRRPWFYSRPFFYTSPSDLPGNVTNDVAATIGGPFIKDRWHYYFGYEYLKRDDNTRSNRQVTITEADKTALIAVGLPASIFVPSIPSQEYGSHFIFRTDAQLNRSNRFTLRLNYAATGAGNFVNGGFNTMERSVDGASTDHSVALQLVSFKPEFLNELRFQFVRSLVSTVRNEHSGLAPSVSITNVANFGSPVDADNINPLVNVAQVQDNLTWTRGTHAIKFGGGLSSKSIFYRVGLSSLYTFPSIDAYDAARNGASPYSYARYEESFGDPETKPKAAYWNFFVQDDWKVTRRLKLNYGLRYDLYAVPEADPASPFPASRNFNLDKNNFAPRFGLVYALREGNRPLVLRAGAGIYYEPPWMDMYERALRNNGERFFTLQFCGDNGGTCQRNPMAPAFPDTFSGTRPPGSVLPPQNIATIASDFENMYAIHSNVQLEQALTDDLSLAVGYVHSGGRHIPVYRNINPINPVSLLADGRPVFGPSRLDPRFNLIQMAESAGVSQYDAIALQLTQRFSRGIQFNANYTFSRAIDDAPEQNVTYSVGGGFITSLVLSDPTDRSLDKGYSYGDQRHTFVTSLVARPHFNHQGRTLRYLLNNNQFGVITTANSGERFSVVAGRDVNGNLSPLDLNRDGISTSDRPVGITRNSGKTPPQFNLDLRYSRLFSLTERYKVEAYCEVQNLFNVNSIIAYNNILVPADPDTGEMVGPMPDFKARNASVALESRQAQIGVKFHF